MTGATIDDTEFGNWLSNRFPSRGYLRVGLASAGVAFGLFLLGYATAVLGDLVYLSEPDGYLAAFAVFWALTALGLADGAYVDVWNDSRSAFAVDDEAYRDVVRPRLERIYDERRILTYATVIAVPFFAIVSAIYLPGSPFRDTAIAVFLANEPSPLPPRVLRVGLYYLFGGVNAVLVATAVNGFVNHLALVSEVSKLPFEDLRTSASVLEPVGRFTIASATVWFAGISILVLWIEAGVSGNLGTVTIGLLVFAGVVFFLAPQLILHDALLEAKRDLLAEIRAEYEEMHERARGGGEPSESLSFRLEVTDRRLESANSIRTWVYDLSSVGKLVAASVIPWLTLAQELVSTVRLGG